MTRRVYNIMLVSQFMQVSSDMPAFGGYRWNLVMWLMKKLDAGDAVTGVLMISGVLLCIIVPYLLGSINPAILFSKLIWKDDIRRHGSGNAGTTNMLRTFGLKAAALTLICDFAKAIIAVWFGMIIFAAQWGGAVAGLFVVLGHMFPIYYRFKGGKGVACAGMVALAFDPIIFLFLALIFLIVVIGTRYVSLASIMCALFYPLLFNAFSYPGLPLAMSVLIAVFVFSMHIENMQRLWNHEESKLDFSKFSLKKRKQRKLEEKAAREAEEAQNQQEE